MPTATIEYPSGPHVNEGGRIDLVVKYTGPDPPPDDVHLLTRTGGGNWTEQFGGDVPPGINPRAGVSLRLPVGNDAGTFDLRVDWTWKPDRRETGSDQGQYFVDVPPPPVAAPSADPIDENEGTPWWQWLLFPLSGPAELGLLILYAPFWLLKLLGFGNPLEGWLKKLLEAIRDNLLPPPFNSWFR